MSQTNTLHKKRFKLPVFDMINVLIMLFVIVVMLYPFLNTVAISFNDAQDTLRGGIGLWPRVFSAYSYEMVFKSRLMLTAAFNSVARTLLATVLSVFFASLVGYVLSRPELVGRKFITAYFLVTMYVSAGLIPNYFLIKSLGLLNNFMVYILPGMISVFNVIVIKAFMQSLPESLTEAAIVDGAGHFRCYWNVVLPCCKPVLATVALWCAVGAWNSWFDTFLYAPNADHMTTLQYEMMKLLSSSMQTGRDTSSVFGNNSEQANIITPVSIRSAVTIVASVPILVVYPFLQKYFVKGVMLGAVKG
ncbi:MAG: carbohydrate ABC transporter permease [Clostridia bacterium]|nr:carbohydrate ABC transporter permease [Clostridia bacterium]